jgi:hypothetical protein
MPHYRGSKEAGQLALQVASLPCSVPTMAAIVPSSLMSLATCTLASSKSLPWHVRTTTAHHYGELLWYTVCSGRAKPLRR